MITWIVEAVSFVIIIVILARWHIAWPAVKEMLRRREETVRREVEESEQARERLAEAERAYQNAVTEARTESAQIRENARAEAQRTVEEQQLVAQQEYERIVARGEEQLASQRAAVVRELRGELGTLAVELSERIVAQRLAEADQLSATVDSFLTGLESAQRPQSGASA